MNSSLRSALSLYLTATLVCLPAYANPTGASVVAGDVRVDTGPSGVTITQGSSRAIINWQDFSIGAGEVTTFLQPDASSAVLNRVISGRPSHLQGRLDANGRVYLINPNGVLFGADARINVGGFLASTLDVSDEAFLKGGDLLFLGDSTAAVQNLGRIDASGGDVFLISRRIENAGTMRASGTVAAAAGSEVLLTTDNRIFVRASSAPGEVLNRAEIEAARVELRAVGGNTGALAINNSGTVRATGTAERDGQVWLVADRGDTVSSGSLSARSADGARGGDVRVLGQRVALTEGARVDVSGSQSGGVALIGGDFQGGYAGAPNASATTVQAGARLQADGGVTGGRVIVWSDGTTDFGGSVSTRGTGFVEVSGKDSLRFHGDVDTGGGTLLLDPANITVKPGTVFNGGGSDLADGLWAKAETGDQIGVDNLRAALNSGSVVLQASNTITWEAAATLDYNGLGTGRSLTLQSDQDINFSGKILDSVAGGDALSVTLNSNRDAIGTGAIHLFSGAQVITNGGHLVLGGGSDPLNTGAVGNAGSANRALYIDNALLSSGAGNISLRGTGGNSGGGLGIGVDLLNTIVESTTGEIQVVGTGAAGATNTNLGISIFSGSQIRTTAGGNIIVTGSASASGTFNAGINIESSGSVRTLSGGNITLHGSGSLNGSGTLNHGIYLQGSSSVLMNGNGTLTLTGVTGAGSSGIATATGTNVIGNSIPAAFTGDLRLSTDWISLANVSVSGSGRFFLQPLSTSQGMGLGDGAAGNLNLTNVELGTLANGFSSLTFGHAAGTGAIDVRTVAFKDSVIFQTTGGGLSADITINGAVSTGSGSDAGSITLLASDGVTLATGGQLSTQGHAVLLVSDRDSDGAGATSLVSGTSIVTNGGDLTLRGGSAALTTLPDPTLDPSTFKSALATTSAGGSGTSGVSLSGATLNAGGGSIEVRGLGGAGHAGVVLSGGTLVTTAGTGAIMLSGAGGASGDENDGVRMEGANTAVTSVGGGITIYGLGQGSGASQGISLTGPGPAAPRIESIDGSILLRGRSTGTASGNQGIALAQSSLVRTTGAGDIDGSGRTTGNAGDAHGLWLATSSQVRATGSGDIRLDGQTDATGGNKSGLVIAGSSLVQTDGTGSIDLSGRTHSTVGGNVGVLLSSSTVRTTGGGNVTFTGTSTSNGTASNNEGIKIDLSTVEIQSGSDRLLTFNGNGGTGTNYNIGINVRGSGSVVRMGAGVTGAMVMNGTGGAASGTGNWGVLVEGDAVYESLGAAAITFNGIAGTGADSHGIKHSYGSTNRIGSSSMTGDITFNADTIDLQSAGGTVTVVGKGALNIRPLSPVTTIGIGSGATGTLNLNTTELSRLADGFSLISIGSSVGTGTVTVGSATFSDALHLISAGPGSGGIALDGNVNVGANTLVLESKGSVRQSAALTAGELLLRDSGAFTLSHAGNSVGTLGASGTGSLHYVNAGALTLGSVAGTDGISGGSADVLVRTLGGDLTVARPVSTGGVGNLTLVAGANFTNTAGASALTTDAGRWLVWSGAPATDTRGGLTPGFKQYAATYGVAAPAQSAGNGFLYRTSPVLTPILTGSVSRVYDATTSADLGGAVLAATGILDNDTVGLIASGAAAFGDRNVGAGKTVSVGGLSLTGATNGGVTVYGYTLGSTTASGAIGSITPATLTYVANPATREYGLSNPAFSGAVSGLAGDDTAASALTGTLTFASVAAPGSNVGTYAVTGSGLSANHGNYVFTQHGGNATALSVTPAPLAVTAADASRTYGAANPGFGAILSGLRNGDTGHVISGLDFSTSATSASGVGVYGITPYGGSALNYTLSYTSGTLTVSPAALTVTGMDASRIYGQANPALTATITGLVNGETADVLSGTLALATTATAGTNVGTYDITPSGLSSANYAITYAPGTLTVSPAALTVTANNRSMVYGDTLPAFDATYQGFVNGDTAGVVSGLGFHTAATSASNVGLYGITPGGATAQNYTISYVDGQLSISPARLAVIADSFERVYGDPNPVFTATVKGLRNHDGAGVLQGLVFSTAATALSPAGGYTITPSGATASNYTIDFYDGMLAVDRALLKITADDLARTYGSSNPDFTAQFSGLLNGDTHSVVTGLTFATSATPGSDVGTYAVLPGGGSAANYVIAYIPGLLTVDPAPLTISGPNATKVYGAALPVLGASFSGLRNGDTAAQLPGLQVTTAATAASDAGQYVVTAGGAQSRNYTITYLPGTLSVTPAPLTITADNASRAFGLGNPTLTASYAGLVNGDTEAAIPGVTLATTATTASPVGTYAITVGGGSSNNYVLSYVPGVLDVFGNLLTITANNASTTYGASLPAFSASYHGLVGSDTPSVVSGLQFSTTASVGSNVGSYSITPFGGSATNYSLAYVPGTLTINPAALTITAADATRLYGAADPVFGARFSGFVAGDDVSDLGGQLVVTPGADAASGVGVYSLTPSGPTSQNYTISFVNGVLAVTPAPLVVTANSVTRPFGAANPAFSARYTGFVLGQDASVLGGTLAFATAADAASAVGSYTITPSGLTSSNYALSFVDGTLGIGTSLLTVRANDASRTYGESNPAFTATFAGFLGSDTPSSLQGSLAFSTAATVGSNVGTYSIMPYGVNSPNYTMDFVPGVLTVNPAALLVSAQGASRAFGAPNPGFTARYEGFVLGETPDVLGGTLGFSTGATTASPAGKYAVTPFGLTSSNYTISFGEGLLSIGSSLLTIRADDVSRLYGAPNPGFTATIEGFAQGDSLASLDGTLAFSTEAVLGSNVGTYRITPYGVSSSNYDISFVDGRLTIRPADLLVTVLDSRRSAGSNNPAFGVRYDGWQVDDGISDLGGVLAFETGATPSSGPGAYVVTADGLVSSNYRITYRRGTLTVEAPQVVVGERPLEIKTVNAVPAVTSSFAAVVVDDRVKLLPVVTGAGDSVQAPSGRPSVDEQLTTALGSVSPPPVAPAVLVPAPAAPASSAVAAAPSTLPSLPAEPGLAVESAVSMGRFRVIYREDVDTVRRTAAGHTAADSSYRTFGADEKPETVIVRAAGRADERANERTPNNR